MPGRLYTATWSRVTAAMFDRFTRPSEDAGLRDRRRGLLAQASGATLELGAGTGLNLEHYPPAVTELVLTEPGAHMGRHLRRRLAASHRPVQLVDASAEQLPFPDERFDTVVGTLVMCTIPHPERALAEAARVLRPGGRLLFMEHVRSGAAATARWQDRLERPWYYLADGCHCNRDTLATIQASPLTVQSLEHAHIPKAPAIVRPLIIGSAARAG